MEKRIEVLLLFTSHSEHPVSGIGVEEMKQRLDTTSGVVMERNLSTIGQIAITVSDVEKALSFYRDALGLKFLFAAGPNLAFLDADGIRLMLNTPQGAGTVGGNSIVYFKVSDIETTYASVVSRGAVEERSPQLAAKMPDHELWIGFIRDPDGSLVGLMEEKR